MQIVGDGHADAQREGVGVGGADDVFDAGFGEGVEAAAEVGGVFFGEGAADEGVVLVVVLRGIDACIVLVSPIVPSKVVGTKSVTYIQLPC